MPLTTSFLLHSNGPALWSEHKPLAEVLDLQATTPVPIWEATYQGNAVPPEGTVFMRSWWSGKNRFDIRDQGLVNSCIARWISFDTGMKDEEENAFTAAAVGELWADYRLAIRFVYRERLQFPALPDMIADLARKYNADRKLRGIIIEDKASGTSAFQTLSKSSERWLIPLLIAFMPTGDKIQRANQAAVWAKQDCILLPHPSPDLFWLIDFEDELFSFPGSAFKDQVDAFSQLILYTENYLEEGYRARNSL